MVGVDVSRLTENIVFSPGFVNEIHGTGPNLRVFAVQYGHIKSPLEIGFCIVTVWGRSKNVFDPRAITGNKRVCTVFARIYTIMRFSKGQNESPLRMNTRARGTRRRPDCVHIDVGGGPESPIPGLPGPWMKSN